MKKNILELLFKIRNELESHNKMRNDLVDCNDLNYFYLK